MSADELPQLHPIRAKCVPADSWVPAGVETLPTGWVNVRLYCHDFTRGVDRYTTELCPGILHSESTVLQTVIQGADLDGNLWDEYGEPYDDHPVVVETMAANPPYQLQHYADPDWRPAYLGGGYLGTCKSDAVRELLSEHGFADAIPLLGVVE